jgi:hypothetical protein
MPNILDPIVPPALLTSAALCSISFASCPKQRVESGNMSSFPKLASAQLPCSIAEPGLKNAKLGIEGTGEENSKALESSLLRKENPADAVQGVDGSAIKVEKDDLHVNVGDSVSHVIGDPAPKLMSSFLDINEVEKEPPPIPHSLQLRFSRPLGSSGPLSFIQEWSTKEESCKLCFLAMEGRERGFN